ncbi:MAG: LytTR family DNA-binding domain-containing protein [Muribaculaceae bacterium]|nr:LytTR family DNA-binding domain-containing protein [Muribaculaceae bacterium]
MTETGTIRCLVVDDEPLAAALISSYVNRTPGLVLVGEAHNADAALAVVNAEAVDLVFLDIHMPGLSGTQLARLLPATTRVVFTTAYTDHALEGFRLDALHYLLKPVSYEEFMEAIVRARRLLQSRPDVAETAPDEQTQTRVSREFITVKSEYRLVRIPVAEIEYIEGLKDYVKIYTAESDKAILSLMSIKSLEDTLPPEQFMRVHRSFIVNIDKVRVVERNCIIMGGRAIPVSDSYRRDFLARIG